MAESEYKNERTIIMRKLWCVINAKTPFFVVVVSRGKCNGMGLENDSQSVCLSAGLL